LAKDKNLAEFKHNLIEHQISKRFSFHSFEHNLHTKKRKNSPGCGNIKKEKWPSAAISLVVDGEVDEERRRAWPCCAYAGITGGICCGGYDTYCGGVGGGGTIWPSHFACGCACGGNNGGGGSDNTWSAAMAESCTTFSRPGQDHLASSSALDNSMAMAVAASLL
jgi:hypothetical protein